MKLFNLSPFEVEKEKPYLYKNNPPLSEEGIRKARKVKLTLPTISFDLCFTSTDIRCYASAMLTVGDKVIIDRDKRLNKPLDKVEVDHFLTYLDHYEEDKTILLVVEDEIIKYIKKKKKHLITLN